MIEELAKTIYGKDINDFRNELDAINDWFSENSTIISDIDTNSLKIEQEITRATSVESELRKDLNDEILRSTAAEFLAINLNKEIVYEELVELTKSNKLIPGQKYRITDYECIINSSWTDIISAGHRFDIIVEATTVNTLSEVAKAALHEDDTYFSNCNIESWELRYRLDNDNKNFAWATTNGKGVIYWMRDDKGNEAPYDFKNLKFQVNTSDILDTNFYYTFDLTYEIGDVIVNEDISVTEKNCYSNVIHKRIKNNSQLPNYIVFINNDKNNINCHSNIFSENCYYNRFGNNCFGNTFDVDCSENVFGNNIQNNVFGKNCIRNYFIKEIKTSSNNYSNIIQSYGVYNSHFSGNMKYCDIILSLGNLTNAIFGKGIVGSGSTREKININISNQDYEIKVSRNSIGTIRIYCEADILDSINQSGEVSKAEVLGEIAIVSGATYQNEVALLNGEVNDEVLSFRTV